ncbi:MAG: accessory gene regulator B family protein [Ruminococcus sp.]|nr:accessory gene regulator B family protein [Ruminococcus sp.]
MAETITQKLEENNTIQSENREIYRYGFQQGFTILLNIVTIVIIGLLLKSLLQAFLFMMFYFPLRSYAGGFHAKTAVRCYVYSMVIIVLILLVIRFAPITNLIYTIITITSSVVILSLAPVQDHNKPLDQTERKVYRFRTLIVWGVEIILFTMALYFGWQIVANCLSWVFAIMALILCLGVINNRI